MNDRTSSSTCSGYSEGRKSLERRTPSVRSALSSENWWNTRWLPYLSRQNPLQNSPKIHLTHNSSDLIGSDASIDVLLEPKRRNSGLRNCLLVMRFQSCFLQLCLSELDQKLEEMGNPGHHYPLAGFSNAGLSAWVSLEIKSRLF